MKISTAEIKKYLKECTAIRGDSTPPDFYNYIKENSNKEFTKGQVAGAISQLAESGDLIKIERGLYRRGLKKGENSTKLKGSINSSKMSKLIEEGNTCLENMKKELTRIADRVEVLDTTEEEFKYLAELKRIKQELEKVMEQYK